MNVAMVIVGEDCALPTSNSKSTGRRGLCGVVLVNKVHAASLVTATSPVKDGIIFVVENTAEVE